MILQLPTGSPCLIILRHTKVNDSLTSGNFEMAAPGRNRPIMHYKPLSFEYVMYAYGLCLFYLILQSGN